MCDVSRGGNKVYASIETLARLSKLSRRHCDRLIKGYFEKRKGKRVKGFLERGILTQVSKPGEKKRTAVYLFHEDALHDAPELQGDIEKAGQMDLPGIMQGSKSEIPIQPIGDEYPKIPDAWTLAPISSDTPPPPLTRHGVQYVKNATVDTVSSPLSGHGVQSLTRHGVHRFKSFESRPISQNQPQPVFLNSQILKCETCGGAGLVHQSSHLPGARLIPCPECNRGGVS